MYDVDKLTKNVLEYVRNVDSSDNTDEEYYNFYSLLENNPKGVLASISSEIREYIMNEDLRNDKIRKNYDGVCNLAKELNSYCNYFEEKNDN